MKCRDCGLKKVDCYEEFEMSGGGLVRWYWCAPCYVDRMKLLKGSKAPRGPGALLNKEENFR